MSYSDCVWKVSLNSRPWDSLSLYTSCTYFRIGLILSLPIRNQTFWACNMSVLLELTIYIAKKCNFSFKCLTTFYLRQAAFFYPLDKRVAGEGFEPTTSRLWIWRATELLHPASWHSRIWTCDQRFNRPSLYLWAICHCKDCNLYSPIYLYLIVN